MSYAPIIPSRRSETGSAPTTPLPPRQLYPAGIPTALRDLPQWANMAWPTKVPLDPRTGERAKANDPRTCGTFDEAKATTHEHKLGLMFLLLEADPFFVLDQDDVRDPVSGHIEPAALERARRLGTYTEISISGTGLHTIGIGRKPATHCRVAKLELYDRARFVALTGHFVPGLPTAIIDCQLALDALYGELFGGNRARIEQEAEPTAASSRTVSLQPRDRAPLPPLSPPMDDREVLRRARASRNNARFRALWRGDIAAYDGDDSRADAALLAMLAFWTQDTAQLDRLYRRSGLCRSAERRRKWEREDYRERTIALVLAAGRECYRLTQPLVLRADGTYNFGEAIVQGGER